MVPGAIKRLVSQHGQTSSRELALPPQKIHVRAMLNSHRPRSPKKILTDPSRTVCSVYQSSRCVSRFAQERRPSCFSRRSMASLPQTLFLPNRRAQLIRGRFARRRRTKAEYRGFDQAKRATATRYSRLAYVHTSHASRYLCQAQNAVPSQSCPQEGSHARSIRCSPG
jgi:hypothetical protein